MKINDEGTSNAAHWHERAMKAEARLAEAEALLREARSDLRLWCDAYESPQDTLRLIQRINAVLGKGE